MTNVAVARNAIKKGANELCNIYEVCGAKAPEEKHRVRAAIEALYKKGEVVHAARAVWIDA